MLKTYVSVAVICLLTVIATHSPSAYSEFMAGIPDIPAVNKATKQPLPTLSSIEKKTADINQQISKATNKERIQDLNYWLTLLEQQTLVIKKINNLEETLYSLPNFSITPSETLSITQYDDIRDNLQQQEALLQSTKEQLRVISDTVKSRISDHKKSQRQRREITAQNTSPIQIATAKLNEHIAFEQLSLARLEYHYKKEQLNALQKRFANTIEKKHHLTQQVLFSYQELQQQLQQINLREQQLNLKQAQLNQQLNKSQALWDEQQNSISPTASPLELETLHKQLLSKQQQLELTTEELSRLSGIYDAWELRYSLFQHSTPTNITPQINRLQTQLDAYDNTLNNLYTLYDNLIIEKSSLAEKLANNNLPALERKWFTQQKNISEQLSNVLFNHTQQLKTDKKLITRIYHEAKEKINQRSFSDYASIVFTNLYSVWDTELFSIEDRSITLGKFLIGFLLLISGVWISKALTRLIGQILRHRFELNESITSIVESLSFYLLLATVILFALNLINIPLTIFTMLGGALAIGIGFGSQNLMNNFISGLILLAERPIRVGDFIQIEQLKGVVNHIGARSTHINTPENVNIIVPNSSFLQDRVTNWTLNDNRIRTSITVGVAYGSPTRDVAKLLKKAAERHGNVLKNPKPIVLFTDFADNSLNFELIIWVTVRRLIERRIIESDLRFQVDQLFKDAGIEIAFPQRDIHLDNKTPLTVRMSKEPQEPIE